MRINISDDYRMGELAGRQAGGQAGWLVGRMCCWLTMVVLVDVNNSEMGNLLVQSTKNWRKGCTRKSATKDGTASSLHIKWNR